MATYGPTGVAAGGDDYYHQSNGPFSAASVLYVGAFSASVTFHFGMRFLGVDIPTGATISSSTIDFRSLADTAGSGNFLSKICAVDENDPAAATDQTACAAD